jgi:hypothetical protein
MTRKRKWAVVFAAAALIVVCLLHAPILRGMARLLIVDQPADDFDYVCIATWGHGGGDDRCYDLVGDLCREKASRRVLLVGPDASRVERIGAMPSFEATSRRELGARGVPRDSILWLRGGRWSDWENARALAAWLTDRPGAVVVLLCDQFRSATVRRILDVVLGPADAARVLVRALPSESCDDTNWWRRRCGYRAFAGGWLLRVQNWFNSGHAESPPESNADQYQRDFLQRLPQRTP